MLLRWLTESIILLFECVSPSVSYFNRNSHGSDVALDYTTRLCWGWKCITKHPKGSFICKILPQKKIEEEKKTIDENKKFKLKNTYCGLLCCTRNYKLRTHCILWSIADTATFQWNENCQRFSVQKKRRWNKKEIEPWNVALPFRFGSGLGSGKIQMLTFQSIILFIFPKNRTNTTAKRLCNTQTRYIQNLFSLRFSRIMRTKRNNFSVSIQLHGYIYN